MSSRGPAPVSPPAVTVRLNGNLTAQVHADGAGRTLVVSGIRSARTLRRLARAVASWHAFGRYDRVVLDVSDLSDASPDLSAVLADDVRKAAATGRCLDFLPRARWTVRHAAPASRPDGRPATPARHPGDDVRADTRGPRGTCAPGTGRCSCAAREAVRWPCSCRPSRGTRAGSRARSPPARRSRPVVRGPATPIHELQRSPPAAGRLVRRQRTRSPGRPERPDRRRPGLSAPADGSAGTPRSRGPDPRRLPVRSDPPYRRRHGPRPTASRRGPEGAATTRRRTGRKGRTTAGRCSRAGARSHS